MSNDILELIVKDRDYVVKNQLFKILKDYELGLNEFILLIYFLNSEKPVLDVKKISSITYLNDKDILSAFSILSAKGLIVVKMVKEKDVMLEIIDLSNVYKAMVSIVNSTVKESTKVNIFEVFEKEFGRTLSPIEFEIVNAWISSGISEDLIIGALKEATYNGVSNLRYIDKIIFEWGKNGFKSMKDVDEHLKKRRASKPKTEEKELFDYNWLDDDE